MNAIITSKVPSSQGLIAIDQFTGNRQKLKTPPVSQNVVLRLVQVLELNEMGEALDFA